MLARVTSPDKVRCTTSKLKKIGRGFTLSLLLFFLE